MPSSWLRANESLSTAILSNSGGRLDPRRTAAQVTDARRDQSVPARIPTLAKGREELQVLDAALQLVADFLGAGDEVVGFEQALFLGDVDRQRHDQRVRQCLQTYRRDLRHRSLLRQIAEVLLRQLRQPRALRIGGGEVTLDLRLCHDARDAIRLARDFIDDAEARL